MPFDTCRHSLEDECRILLLHGVLHLMGLDHEEGPEEAERMGQLEEAIMDELGWKVGTWRPACLSWAGRWVRHQEGTSCTSWNLDGDIMHKLGWKVGTLRGTSCMGWADKWVAGGGHHA